MRRLVDYVGARLDQADHRMLVLLKCLLRSELPDATAEQATQAVLGFRYSIFEPGSDSMTLWSESHQVVTATAEYLAGQLFSEQVFGNDGRVGARHRRAARAKLMVWMSDRFRFGFSEWLSSTYLAVDIAALTMLVDHADDPVLAQRAAIIIDVALTDIALHSFRGQFVPSMGRSYAAQLIEPQTSLVADIWASAFTAEPRAVELDRISSLFTVRENYRVPETIKQIASEMPVRQVLTSQGLDVEEVPDELREHPEFPRGRGFELLRFWWGQLAVTTPAAIVESVRAIRNLNLERNRTLAPLGRYLRMPDRLLVPTLKLANPITQGSALNRANVQTVTTPNYLLSSAQRYQPGMFGDQQHIWHASLPGDIQVFGTHPGSTQLGHEIRDDTPGHWVGNGINPDVAQHHNVLLALHNLTGRKGMFEGRRTALTHIRFPFVLFDQTRLGPTWLAGRRDDAYIGILSTEQIEQVSETEIVQRGVRTGFAVVLGDDEEYTSMAEFLRQLKQYRLRLTGDRLVLTSPYGRYELVWQGDFKINGRVVDAWYPRYDSIAVRAPRNPRELTITGIRHELRLDWMASTRTESELG